MNDAILSEERVKELRELFEIEKEIGKPASYSPDSILEVFDTVEALREKLRSSQEYGTTVHDENLALRKELEAGRKKRECENKTMAANLKILAETEQALRQRAESSENDAKNFWQEIAQRNDEVRKMRQRAEQAEAKVKELELKVFIGEETDNP